MAEFVTVDERTAATAPSADGRVGALAAEWPRPTRRAVFLDRDGTLNAMVYNPDHGTVDSPLRPDELRLLPGAAEAVRRVNELGFLAIVVSNQPAVAKGKTSLALVEATTARLRRELAAAGARLDGVYYCLHHPKAEVARYRARCGCRKPEPGLLAQAAADVGIDLGRSYVVGDGLTDVAAGQRAGCRTIWLGSARCDWCGAAIEHDVPRPNAIVRNVSQAVDAILANEEGAWGNADLHRHGRPAADPTLGGLRRR